MIGVSQDNATAARSSRYNSAGDVSCVAEDALPVVLPRDVNLDKPQSPLPHHRGFSKTIEDEHGVEGVLNLTLLTLLLNLPGITYVIAALTSMKPF